MATKKDNKWDGILSGALEHQGKAFTMSFGGIEMSRHEAFLASKVRDHLKQDQKRANAIAKRLPGVTVSTKYGALGSKRKGYTVSLYVPEHISTQCYAEVYANEGLPFKDYLLENRKDKLLVICRSIGFLPKFNSFIVSSSGIFDDLADPYHICFYFKDFGMAALENVAQCYGFALAVSEILEKDIFKGQKYVLHYVQGSDTAIKLAFEIIKDNTPPTLNKW